MVHTYMSRSKNHFPGLEYYYHDFYNVSCANGWGMGNLAISAKDAAHFWYEYLGTENIISDATKAILMNFPANIHFEWVEYAYGGGLMYKQYPLAANETDADWRKSTMIGHSGMLYASQAKVTGFNFAYNFSMIVAINTIDGISCSQDAKNGAKGEGFESEQLLNCLATDITLQFLSNGTNPRFHCN